MINCSHRRADSGNNSRYPVNVFSVTTTDFKISVYSNMDNTMKYDWIAIGY